MKPIISSRKKEISIDYQYFVLFYRETIQRMFIAFKNSVNIYFTGSPEMLFLHLIFFKSFTYGPKRDSCYFRAQRLI